MPTAAAEIPKQTAQARHQGLHYGLKTCGLRPLMAEKCLLSLALSKSGNPWACAYRPPERKDLLEVLDDRLGMRSTLITSQLSLKAWHALP